MLNPPGPAKVKALTPSAILIRSGLTFGDTLTFSHFFTESAKLLNGLVIISIEKPPPKAKVNALTPVAILVRSASILGDT